MTNEKEYIIQSRIKNKHPNAKFHSIKCKDRYHNVIKFKKKRGNYLEGSDVYTIKEVDYLTIDDI